jgi:fructose-1,6-bisphosphatase
MNASRRENHNDPRRNERDYPYIVEVMVSPASKLASFNASAAWHQLYNDMHDWHRTRFLEYRSGRGRTEEQNREFVCYVRFCFKERRDAEDFKERFSGALVASIEHRGSARA